MSAKEVVKLGAKYNYEVGKLYDTILYIVTNLFESVMIERIYAKLGKTSELEYDMRFFNELKHICPEIPKDLLPLCYCDIQQVSFLMVRKQPLQFVQL